MQLSPIQCTYSNIFIRFFKFFPANTNIYQNSYSVIRRAVRLTPGCPVIASEKSGTPRDTVYSRGKGINKQKTDNCRVRRLFGQKRSLWRATHIMSLRAENRGPRGILLYPWGKGVCKHKTGDCRLRQSVGQKRSIRRIARKGNLVIKPKTINAILSAFTNFRTWSTPLFINTLLLNPSLYMIARVSFWQFDKKHYIILLCCFVVHSVQSTLSLHHFIYSK